MPGKSIHIALVLFFAFLACRDVYAAVSVTPSSVSVARGQNSTVTLLYRTQSPAAATVTSPNGIFVGPDSIVGTNPVPLVVNQTAGRGRAAESVVVPAAVVERVLRRGVTTFLYRRSFSSGDTADVRISITTDAAAAFGIKRIELYFENRRAEITIP
jgi:hypothetical protein